MHIESHTYIHIDRPRACAELHMEEKDGISQTYRHRDKIVHTVSMVGYARGTKHEPYIPTPRSYPTPILTLLIPAK